MRRKKTQPLCYWSFVVLFFGTSYSSSIRLLLLLLMGVLLLSQFPFPLRLAAACRAVNAY